MTGWKPKILAFQRGLDASKSAQAIGVQPALRTLRNADFGVGGVLRTRPGLRRVTGFSRRGFDANANPTDTTVATLAATGYASPTMNVTRRDGDRPLLLTRGRAFTWETTDGGAGPVARWSDRAGVLQARWDYVGNLRQSTVSAANPFGTDTTLGLATSFDFGPGPFGGMAGLTSRLSEEGEQESSVTLAKDFTRGNGAAMNRGGAYQSAAVYVEQGTNNLRIAGHLFGSSGFSEAQIATDALQGTGMRGAPVICADYDSQSWFVAYWTTTARVFKVLKVSSAFAVTATYTAPAAVLAGANGRALWVTNSSVADDKVVVACSTDAGGGMLTRVLSHALVDQAIDVTTAFGTQVEAITVGVAEGGEFWGTAHVSAATVGLRIFKRSSTAATAIAVRNTWAGADWGQAVAGFANANGAQHLFPVHQPVKVAGRVLIGVGTSSPMSGTGPGAGAGYVYTACRWYVFDVTDLNVQFSTTGTLADPVMVARGELDAVPFYGARAAIVDPDDSAHYRFPVVTWDDVVPVVSSGKVTHFASGGIYTAGGGAYTHRLVDLTVEPGQVAQHKSATIIAGAVPRVLSSGNVQPVGFPWQGAPGLNVTPAGGASSFGVVALWSYTDEAGQVHRSEPSQIFTVTAAALPLTVVVTNPLFAERDVGTVYCEVYVTTANPTAATPHYFAARALRNGNAATQTLTVTAVNDRSEILYTDGNVMAVRHPSADGGAAAVGARTWISDGRAVIASRLGAVGGREAPSWNDDGPLRLELPASAGRVVGLSGVDDKLLIFCTGGVWATTGDGPDDTGQGTQFRDPVQISPVGAASGRTIVAVPGKGAVFLARYSNVDSRGSTGGLYMVDRSLTVQQIGRELSALSTTWARGVTDGTYWPEADAVLFTRDASTGAIMYDLREGKWSTWDALNNDFPVSVAAVGGVLWGVGIEPSVFDITSGIDSAGAGGDHRIQLQFVTSDLPVSTDPFARGRLRSFTPLAVAGANDPSYTVSVTLDEEPATTTTDSASGVSIAPFRGPEFVLRGRQKCRVAVLDVLVTSDERVEIAGIQLLVKDEPGTARTNRSVTS